MGCLKSTFPAVAVVGSILFATACQQGAEQVPNRSADAPAPQMVELKVGDEAPDFTLPDHEGNETKLSDFRGTRNVVLAFYVFAFTGG